MRRHTAMILALACFLLTIVGGFSSWAGKPKQSDRKRAQPSTPATPSVNFGTPAPVATGPKVARATGAVFQKHSPPLRPDLLIEEEPVYKGTDISPDPSATGEVLAVQQEVAIRLGRLDYKSPRRLAHFQWLDQPNIQVIGWHGWIQQATRTPDGWLLRVRMMPRLRTPGASVALTRDHFFEIYEYKDGKLNHVDSIDPGDAHKGKVDRL